MFYFKICLIMTVFRNRPKGFVSPPSEKRHVHSLERIEETCEEGILVKEIIVPMSQEEYIDRHPPLKDEFTVLQQLSAGVSVKEVPTNGLLDSPDNLDYPENEVAEQKVLEALEKDNN